MTGTRLKDARKRLGLTQQALAKLYRMPHYQTIGQWERSRELSIKGMQLVEKLERKLAKRTYKRGVK